MKEIFRKCLYLDTNVDSHLRLSKRLLNSAWQECYPRTIYTLIGNQTVSITLIYGLLCYRPATVNTKLSILISSFHWENMPFFLVLMAIISGRWSP